VRLVRWFYSLYSVLDRESAEHLALFHLSWTSGRLKLIRVSLSHDASASASYRISSSSCSPFSLISRHSRVPSHVPSFTGLDRLIHRIITRRRGRQGQRYRSITPLPKLERNTLVALPGHDRRLLNIERVYDISASVEHIRRPLQRRSEDTHL